MGKYGKRAEEYFSQGYNCAQAVLLAFSDITNLDDILAAKISSPFGAGIGRLREVCGAFTGAVMVMGIHEGVTDPRQQKEKRELYDSVQAYAEKFKQVNGGSIVCGELLGLKEACSAQSEGKERHKKKPCTAIVVSAADALAAFFGLEE